MFKVQWHKELDEGFNMFDSEIDAKHFAIDSAYEGYQCSIYEAFIPSCPKQIYRTERIGTCYAVLPV